VNENFPAQADNFQKLLKTISEYDALALEHPGPEGSALREPPGGGHGQDLGALGDEPVGVRRLEHLVRERARARPPACRMASSTAWPRTSTAE
jgi:hypothetical protein